MNMFKVIVVALVSMALIGCFPSSMGRYKQGDTIVASIKMQDGVMYKKDANDSNWVVVNLDSLNADFAEKEKIAAEKEQARIEKEADHTWEVTDQDSWNAAISGINNAGEDKKHLILVKNSFSPNSSLYTYSFYVTTKNIVVILEGNATISFSPNGRTTSLFDINNGQIIIVKNLKLQGHSNSTESLVHVRSGGKFIMEGRASVSGNSASGSSLKVFSSCSNTDYPGGVNVNGTFIMKDNSSVSGNSSNGKDCHGREFGQGGGVRVAGGKFIMQDNASVIGNTAAEYGGGVSAEGTFIMKDNALVTGNKANTGGGVWGRTHSVTIEGNAKVSGNTAISDNDIRLW